MKPKIGKWYNIEHGEKNSKSGYHGIAKCIKFDRYESFWWFVTYECQELGNPLYFFKNQDVKSECKDPPPAYKIRIKLKILMQAHKTRSTKIRRCETL